MIVLYPNPVLRKKSKKVSLVNEEVLEVIKFLKKDLDASPIGVALSAPQIGKSWRIVAFKDTACDCESKNCQCICFYINPQITNDFGKEKERVQLLKNDESQEDFLEGCLSFPNICGTVKRWLKIRVKYQVVKNNKLVDKEEELEGFKSIVFQHELDHLNGILFIDHIKEEEGKIYREEEGKLIKISIDSIKKD